MIENLTLGEIVATISVVALLVGWIRSALKPIQEFNKRIDNIEQHQDNDNKRLNKLEDDTHMILKTCLVLIKHGEDNNHTGELEETENELTEYLIKRKL